MAVSQYGSMEVSRYGCGIAAVWLHHGMAVSRYGSITVWQYGSITVWQYHSMAVSQYGSITVWQYHRMAHVVYWGRQQTNARDGLAINSKTID